MAALEIIALDTTTPQLRAPGSSDTYSAPRSVEVNPGTLTTAVSPLTITATYNAAVTFPGIVFNLTDTSSNSNSLFLDLKTGGTSKFKIAKDGSITTSDTSVTHNVAGNFILGNYISLGSAVYYRGTSGLLGRDASDTYRNGIYTPSANLFEFKNALALTTAQTLKWYRSYTDASNYSRFTAGWNTSTALLMADGAGTGSDGSVAFNDAALATTATVGFVMIPSCAGAPTGIPADIPTGQIPLVFDSTNNKIYAYDGAWISTAALA